MIKYGLPLLLAVSVIILGVASPYQSFMGPRADPVPSFQKVAHSNHCAGCHGKDATGQALVDKNGDDVNIFDDWQISMMGLSSHDPFWRATLAHETHEYPAQKSAIEEACLKCHAPIGSYQAHYSGLAYSFEFMLQDSLGLDGVSCSACHQQPSEGLGRSHSGNIIIDTNRIMFGQYPNPFIGPMQIYVGFEPVFSDHIYSSGICAGCHTLITETLDDDGVPTGNGFIEQATYHEWLNSIYPAQGKECQTCHLPFIQDSVVIATDFLSLKKRHPFGLHQFFGANTAMLNMMKENRTNLGIAPGSSDASWEESIVNNRISLSQSGSVQLAGYHVADDTLYVDLIIKNRTGHKLPSGYPSRIAWLQVVLIDDGLTDTIYANGLMNHDGQIEGRDFPFEEHHQVSTSPEDVQIYEMVMSDIHGHLTTRLNAAAQPLKDNRLLPRGFRINHSAYDTTAVWGNAGDDDQYSSSSQLGEDHIQYRISLGGRKGIASLDAKLMYHTFPSRWMKDLFESDSISYVSDFKSMYQGYETFSEVIDILRIDEIQLFTSSSLEPIRESNVNVYPNPSSGNAIQVEWPETQNENLEFRITDVHGQLIQEGKLTHQISFSKKLNPGLYFLHLYQKGKLVSTKSFVIS